MKLEQISYSVDNVIEFKESVNEYLKQRCTEERTTEINEKIQGGILNDIRYSWLAKGPKLEVLHTKSGAKVAAWCFRAQHDFDTGVTCVADLANAHGRAPLLVVGLECEITGGMVCVFDVGSSRVIRAIQVDDKVTAIEVVSGGCDSSLPGVLRALDGVIAVGTAKGKVLLIDLCRQICEEVILNNTNETIRDEINSCHLIYLSYEDLRNLESHKEKSLNRGDHLCLQLNENSTSDVHFSLFGPSGEVRLRANMSEVIISSLHFSNPLGSLLVGYNFGAWQLYNLLSSPCPTLDYTSPMYEDCIPVGHFAVQEPCDDPRAFCYVWVAYSVQDPGDAGTSIAVMYALTYQTKEYLEGYGMLYQDLGACSVRFQMELGETVGGRSKNTGARCLTLRSYTRPITNDSPDERLALCTLAWICWDTAAAADTTYLALFDLNQWYKEQMPTQPRALHELNERYMACVNLTDLLMETTTGGKQGTDILDIRVDPQSISPFICPQRLEEHYYPSALGFRLICATGRQLAWVRSTGAQRHLLSQLELAGPLCLLQPAELYHRCVALGLCPAHHDLVASPTPTQQRALVMSVALEQQLVRWLCRCARDWANGSQASAGCTLNSLLGWAWQRANALKFTADKLCVPLFDHTGQRLDHNALLQLNHAACQLKHLTTLFGTVVHCCDVFFTQEDLEDIRYQWNSLQMISIYLEVLQWLLNVGLLPECPLSMYPRPDESERMSAPYPVESLARFYAQRREELCGDDKQHEESLLFIDQLVERECGGSTLSKQWKCDGGNGLYPPPSLQALLRTYLVEDIDITHKHCLFIYVFLDLAMTLDQSRYKSIITHLIKFPAVFKLSPSIIKMTQAFWQLDHGDFSTAMAQLLDPAVANDDLKPWHHRIVLKALLLQGQHQHALLYQQVRKPPVSSVHDICIVITLLIVNDLLQEAFHFQRQNRSVYNEKEILKHFFTVSDKMKHLRCILQLPLSANEEQSFIDYLRSNPGEDNQNLQVIYYLQRDRYAEAFNINDKFNHSAAGVFNEAMKQGLLGQQDRNFRNVIVSGFKKTLPDISQTLLDYMKKQKLEDSTFKHVEHLIPMSVFVHDSQEQAKYKSTLILASFNKAKETWSHLQDKETPFISTPKIASTTDKHNETPLIYANVMQPEFQSVDIDSEATPAKRMRLSPRQPISSNSMMNTSALHRRQHRLSTTSLGAAESPSLSLLDTPIVKRKSYRENTATTNEFSPVGTPTSILKVRSFIRKSLSPDVGRDARGTSTTPEVLETDNHDMDSDSGITPLDRTTADAIKAIALNIAGTPFEHQRRRSPLGVSPRRPIQRTPRPAVHFEDVGRTSSRSSDGSASDTSTTAPTITKQHLEVHIDVHREQTPEMDAQPGSKDSSKSTDDIFYSPNNSFSDKSENVTQTMEVDQQPEKNVINESRSSLKRKISDTTVKSRRSYKSTTPVKVEVTRNIRESLRSRDSLPKSDESISKSVKSSPIIVTTPAAAKPESSPRKSEIFPKVGGRRSLSRQVLEQNALARAMQLPKMQTRLSLSKISPLENIDQHTVGVEVSYSKTVTSIVKKSSDLVTEETCDKSTLEMKNLFTTEKDPESSAQIIKHIHNEASSKSSLKKVTEVLDEDSEDNKQLEKTNESDKDSEYHILSFTSDIDDSVHQPSYQKDDSFVPESKEEEESQNIDEIEESKIETNQTSADISLETINVELNQSKKANLTETVFEDISSIVEESEESEEEEEEIETSEYIPTKISLLQSRAKETNINVEENSKDSSVSSEKVSSESSDDHVVVEAEIHQTASRDSNAASSVAESNEEDEKNDEEVGKEVNWLVASTDDETSEEEKISNEDEEEEEQEFEEEIDAENIAAEDSEDDNESTHEQSEVSSEDQSSRSSDVIEIKSSSEESLEELKINQSGETIEEENENEEESEQEEIESDHDEDVNVEDQNVEILEDIVEAEVIIEEQEDNLNLEIIETEPDLQMETEEAVENMDQIESEIIDIKEVEQDTAEDIVEVEEIVQDVEESIELPEDVRLEIEECIREDEERSMQENEVNSQEDSIVQINETTIEEQTKAEGNEVKSQEKDSTVQINEATIEKQTKVEVNEVKSQEVSVVQLNEALIEEDTKVNENEAKSQEKDSKVQLNEALIEEETLVNENEANSQKYDSNVQTNEAIIEEGTLVNENKEKSQEDDSNVQMNEAVIVERIEEDKDEEILKLPPKSTDTSKSISQDCLEVMSFSESQEELDQTDILSNVSKNTSIQKIEIESNVPVGNIPRTQEESYVPSRRSKRISSKNSEKEPELPTTPSRMTTRRRSSMIADEEKPVEEILVPRSTRRRSVSVDLVEPSSKPALRASTRKRSASVDVDVKANLAEETKASSKPAPRVSTRTRSASVDVDPKSSPVVQTEEVLKPATRTLRKRSTSVEKDPVKPASRTLRKRSTSVEMEDESTTKPRTPRKKRSTSVEAEELSKRSTRASSVVNLEVIEEEVQPSRRTTRTTSVDSVTSRSQRGSSLEPKQSPPVRRGRKRSIQVADVIDEENESVNSEQKRSALEDIPEKIEEYSATHRLTRRQKMIMEKSLELQELKKLQQEETKPRVADIDPIKLLDKESFTGSPDLEERHHRSSSPASSVDTASSVATRLTPETVTPQRSSRRGVRRTSQNTPTTITPDTPRRSSRTASRDTPIDDVSSVRSVPVVQLDRMEVTRHRSLSPTALHAESVAPSPRSRRKSTRKSVLPVQTDLSKISEENTTEPDNASSEELATAETDTQPKRGRPRKIHKEKKDSEEPQSSQSTESQASKSSSNKQRRTTYKPLQEYALKYSVYKNRKSYKVKKLSRNSNQ